MSRRKLDNIGTEYDMKRITLVGTLGIAALASGLVAAQTPGAKPNDHGAHHPEKAAHKAKATPGMMGRGMMGGGMMEGVGMLGMCPGMLGGAGKFEVTKLAKGVTISITSDDAKVAARVQKMAEAMKLMHEANAQQ